MSKNTAVPALLIERIEKSALPYKTVEHEGDVKVWLGSFATQNDARKVLPRVRCQIASDAFITHDIPQDGPTVEVVPQELAVISQGHKPQEKAAVKEEVKAVIKEEPEIAVKVVEKEAAEAQKPCICICDKKAYKKAEIEAAVTFYKNSSDYNFTVSGF